MKTKDLQGYGHTGLEVRFNLMDQVEISHLLDRIEATINEQKEKINSLVIPVESILPELEKVAIFLRKLALVNRDKASVFEEENKDIEVEA